MAKKDDRPVQHASYFVYKGRILNTKDMPLEDRKKAMARATIGCIRLMNPDYDVELKPECYDLDLEAYFKDAPTIGSLFSTREAQEKWDARYGVNRERAALEG